MNLYNLFHYIHNEIVFDDKVNKRSVFNEEEMLRIYNCLISLYFILKEKYGDEIDNQIEKCMKKAALPTNSSSIKPSKIEILGMCHRNMEQFDTDSLERDIAYLILLLADFNYNRSRIEGDEKKACKFEQKWETALTHICKSFGVVNCPNENYNQTGLALSFLYLYLYIVLKKDKTIKRTLDFWSSNSVDFSIYLPLEGMVNLGYFQYLINKNKTKYCKEVNFDDAVKNGLTIRVDKSQIEKIKITQFDCGFVSNAQLKFSQLVELISVLKKGRVCFDETEVYDYDNYKNLLEVSTGWLKLFHVFIEKTCDDQAKIKLKKCLYDTSCHFAGTGDFSSQKFTCSRILAKIDECNFMVRGIIYTDLYGKVVTCIKSIIFREFPLKTIHYLEDVHNTVMSHLGTFVYALNRMCVKKEVCSEYKKEYCDKVIRAVDGFDFNNISFDNELRGNTLVQMVSWEFIAEIYAYLKTEVVICEYLRGNDQIIRDFSGYSPDLVPEFYEVWLDEATVKRPEVTILEFEGYLCPPKVNYVCLEKELKDFYMEQKAFANKNISDLITNTKSAIIRFFGDTHIEQSEKRCTLRQFMTVSLLIAKRQKGKGSLPNVPEFKYYNSEKRNLSVHTLLTDPNIKCMYKDIAFASKIMEYQNHSFIATSRLDLYNDLVITAYKKITDYFEQQIPIIKTGSIEKSHREDKQLERKITPYELLVSVYHITIDIFDKLLDEMP